MRVWFACCLLGLAACSSMPPAEYDARLKTWEGAHINELMNAWGPPDREYTADGRQFFSWNSQRRGEAGNPSLGVRVGGGGGHFGFSIGSLFGLGGGPRVCSRSAELDAAGKVVHLRWNGDAGYCDKLTPKRS